MAFKNLTTESDPKFNFGFQNSSTFDDRKYAFEKIFNKTFDKLAFYKTKNIKLKNIRHYFSKPNMAHKLFYQIT